MNLQKQHFIVYTITMDGLLMVANFKPLSLHCKPKELSWMSEEKCHFYSTAKLF